MSQEYTEEKLNQIEENIISGMDKELNFEKEMEELSLSIASKLCKKKECDESFQDNEYHWCLIRNAVQINDVGTSLEKGIKIFCISSIAYKFAGAKAKGKSVFVKYSKDLSDETSLIATGVNSLLWNIANYNGGYKVEELGDDDGEQ